MSDGDGDGIVQQGHGNKRRSNGDSPLSMSAQNILRRPRTSLSESSGSRNFEIAAPQSPSNAYASPLHDDKQLHSLDSAGNNTNAALPWPSGEERRLRVPGGTLIRPLYDRLSRHAVGAAR